MDRDWEGNVHEASSYSYQWWCVIHGLPRVYSWFFHHQSWLLFLISFNWELKLILSLDHSIFFQKAILCFERRRYSEEFNSHFSDGYQRHENEFIKYIHLSCWLAVWLLVMSEKRTLTYMQKDIWMGDEWRLKRESTVKMHYPNVFWVSMISLILLLLYSDWEWIPSSDSSNFFRKIWEGIETTWFQTYGLLIESVCNFDAIIFAERDTSI